MSCCSTPIEQARCCEEECASANRHDTGPAPPRRLDESDNLAAFERAAKTRVAARGDQCVGGARHFAGLTSAIAKSATRPMPDDVWNGPRFGAAITSRGLPAQFIIDAGKHLQGPVQHLAVWECQH